MIATRKPRQIRSPPILGTLSTITGADGDKFLQNITHHYWKDNGQGVGSLFSWTGDPAVVQGPEEGIAAETAHVYSSYIGT
ncbi:TPR repeat region-containing protein, partial [Mycobacterium kansasii]